jgi:hypothetical protein
MSGGKDLLTAGKDWQDKKQERIREDNQVHLPGGQQANKRKGELTLKKLFAKRWHSIPVAVVSAIVLVCLLAGSAFAAYSFLTINATIEVREPMVVTMDDGRGAGQQVVSGSIPFSDWGVACDSRTFDLWIRNRANNPITVATVLGGDYGYFTFTGFPNVVIAADSTWYGKVTVTMPCDAVPGNYVFTITFNRS